MNIEDQILHVLLESETKDLMPPFRSMQPIDVKVASKKRDKILSIKVSKKVAECPEGIKDCICQQEFTIKELIERDCLK